MASSQRGRFSRQTGDDGGQSRHSRRLGESVARSPGASQLFRSEESWVEISSAPSSSSLSSIGDEIVTTGLRVQQGSKVRTRRRSQKEGSSRGGQPAEPSTSSQEEYDESESENEVDHVMTSSNEHISPLSRVPPITQHQADLGSESDDDDENATALGRVTDETRFTPQPNAFSHPPSAQGSQRASIPGSQFLPSSSLPSSQQRPSSYTSRASSRPQHSPYNAMSPGYQADNDAALRASLTTLLSCAAAARGLPKRNQTGAPSTSTATRPEITGLRIVPESELMGTTSFAPQLVSPSSRPRSSPSVSSRDAEKGKRKATPSKPSQPRATKKKKIAVVEEAMISPTLLTWLVSAGVMVLVSVVGFSAGYAMGKEVGKQEALNGLTESASCGTEAVRGVGEMRRFRWGNGSRSIAV